MAKVKIALVGVGNIANTHLDSYRHIPDAEIYAICDINPVRLKETADKYGIERRYTDEDVMLAECAKDLDAADVCVWNVNHASCAIKALDAGLNVLCEKPMAYNTAEAVKHVFPINCLTPTFSIDGFGQAGINLWPASLFLFHHDMKWFLPVCS